MFDKLQWRIKNLSLFFVEIPYNTLKVGCIISTKYLDVPFDDVSNVCTMVLIG